MGDGDEHAVETPHGHDQLLFPGTTLSTLTSTSNHHVLLRQEICASCCALCALLVSRTTRTDERHRRVARPPARRPSFQPPDAVRLETHSARRPRRDPALARPHASQADAAVGRRSRAKVAFAFLHTPFFSLWLTATVDTQQSISFARPRAL